MIQPDLFNGLSMRNLEKKKIRGILGYWDTSCWVKKLFPWDTGILGFWDTSCWVRKNISVGYWDTGILRGGVFRKIKICPQILTIFSNRFLWETPTEISGISITICLCPCEPVSDKSIALPFFPNQLLVSSDCDFFLDFVVKF